MVQVIIWDRRTHKERVRNGGNGNYYNLYFDNDSLILCGGRFEFRDPCVSSSSFFFACSLFSPY
jgi:hypothetical protein